MCRGRRYCGYGNSLGVHFRVASCARFAHSNQVAAFAMGVITAAAGTTCVYVARCKLWLAAASSASLVSHCVFADSLVAVAAAIVDYSSLKRRSSLKSVSRVGAKKGNSCDTTILLGSGILTI